MELIASRKDARAAVCWVTNWVDLKTLRKWPDNTARIGWAIDVGDLLRSFNGALPCEPGVLTHTTVIESKTYQVLVIGCITLFLKRAPTVFCRRALRSGYCTSFWQKYLMTGGDPQQMATPLYSVSLEHHLCFTPSFFTDVGNGIAIRVALSFFIVPGRTHSL